MSNIIDLNELLPESIQIKVGADIFTVEPPTVQQTIELQKLLVNIADSPKPKKDEQGNIIEPTAEEVQSFGQKQLDATSKLVEIMKELCNGFDASKLKFAQMMKLVEVVLGAMEAKKKGQPELQESPMNSAT